jgi:nitrous oxide reductase
MQFYNTAENQNEENQEEPEEVDFQDNQEEARQIQAKTGNYENDNNKFSNDVYQQYGNLPQENDNDIEIEQEQGREVVVENEES